MTAVSLLSRSASRRACAVANGTRDPGRRRRGEGSLRRRDRGRGCREVDRLVDGRAASRTSSVGHNPMEPFDLENSGAAAGALIESTAGQEADK